MNSADLLTGLERCPRIPFWGQTWKIRKMKPVEMIEAGVHAGLVEPRRSDWGNAAGEEVYGFGSDPGIDSKQYDQHSEVVHLACIADVVASAIRRPGNGPWQRAPDLPDWRSSCYISPDGLHLRRVVYVTSWNDERHYSLCRAWQTMGEVCFYNLPMQMVVVHLGQHRDGRYHSYWSHGLRHPSGNKKLRFRRHKHADEGFKESWIEIWRENYDDIPTEDWLQVMHADGVLQDLLKKFDISVPPSEARQRVVDLAHRKLGIISNTIQLPMQNFSTCDWPVPCEFLKPCHAQAEPSPAYGFVQISLKSDLARMPLAAGK